MATVSSLTVKIGADIKELQSKMKQASKAVSDFGDRASQMGKTISTRVTAPLAALAGVAVRAWGVQERAEMRVRAALQANGREVDVLFDRYNAFAQQMQKTTVIGDETALSMLAQAENLGLTADAAERAVKNSIAMQSAFGVNAQSALRYTAALEQGNATMLTRYLPALREIEDESERVAKAQELLGNAFATAEADAQGAAGQMQQMKNALGDLMEDVGEVISTALIPLVNRIKEAAEAFQDLDDDTKKFAVTLGVLVAAIGPAIYMIGKLAKLISLILSPLALKIAAVAALAAGILYVIKNWEALTERFADINWWRNAVIDMMQFFLKNNPTALLLKGFNAILDRFGQSIPDPFVGVADTLEKLRGDQREYVTELQSLGGFIESVGGDIGNAISYLSDKIFPDFGSSAEKNANKAGEALRRNLGLPFEHDFGEPIERAVIGTATALGAITIAAERASTATKQIPEHLRAAFEAAQEGLREVTAGMQFAESVAMNFTDNFGAGMANVVVQGEKIIDVLKNIGKLLLSSTIQMGLRMLLTGGVGGGITGGLFGRVFGVNDAIITSSGKIIRTDPQDTIFAMKDVSGMGGGRNIKLTSITQVDGRVLWQAVNDYQVDL